MRRARATLALCAGLLLVSACDGVGREVVDHVKPPPGGPLPPLACKTPPICDTPFASTPSLSETHAYRLHEPALRSCGEGFDLCALGSMATDGGVACDNGHLDDPALLGGNRIECAQIEIVLPVVQGECVFEAKGVELDHVRLRVNAQTDCALSLPGLVAHDTRIELVGPVWLAIEGRAVIEDASFTGERTADGAPLLALDVVEGERVVVGDASRMFEGALQVRHTRLLGSTLEVEEIALESTLFESVLLNGRAVDAVDAVIRTGLIDLGSAVFSACLLEDVEISSCRSLLLAGGNVKRSVLRGCGENLYRIFNVRLALVTIDGWVESDSSIYERIHLGLNGPTDFMQFGGGIDKVAFCDQLRSYRVGEQGYASCVNCEEPGTLDPGGACAVSETDDVHGGAACLPLEGIGDCSDEDLSPRRPRPPRPPAMTD